VIVIVAVAVPPVKVTLAGEMAQVVSDGKPVVGHASVTA
jgi:hypothetical protein